MSPGDVVLREVCCTGTHHDRPCRRVLFESPAEWGAPTVHILVGRERASGLGIVKHCPGCRYWVEIRFQRWRVAA